MNGDKTRFIITWLVAALWAGNQVAAFTIKDYHQSESLNGIFMVIVTALFVSGAAKSRNEAEKKEDEDSKNDNP